MAAALTRRIPVMMSPAEVAAIDDWRFANRLSTRSDAIRKMVAATPDLLQQLKGLLAFAAYLRDHVDPDETKIGVAGGGISVEVSLATLMKNAEAAVSRAEGRA